MSEEFAHDVLLPAVQANSSLRRLYTGHADEWEDANEAARIAQDREDADAQQDE